MTRSDFTPNLNFPYLLSNQAQKHVTVNESLGMLDALLMAQVEAIGTSRPPATRKSGQGWITGSGAADDWQGKDGKLAVWRDEAWTFYTPQTGWNVWDNATSTLRTFDGTNWITSGNTQNLDFIGLATIADKNNPFSLRLNSALMTARETGDKGSGDLRLSLNRQAADNVGSIIFKTGWAGQAELGLVGNNDFSIRIASKSKSWRDALKIDTQSANLAIGGPPSDTNRLTVHGSVALKLDQDSNIFFNSGSLDLHRSGGRNFYIRTRSPGSALCLGATAHDGKADHYALTINANKKETSSAYSIYPGQKLKLDLGGGNRIWRDLYVQNAPITTSDQREKTAITNLEGSTALIARLRPVSYRRKTGTRRHFGFIAQDVRRALDALNISNTGLWCLSDPDDDDSLQALRQEELIAVLVAGMQRLQSRLDIVETAMEQAKINEASTDQS